MRTQYAVRQAEEDTLRRYGLTKEALDARSLGRAATWLFRNHPSPGYGPEFRNVAKDVAHTGANFAREIAVGSPVDAWHAFRQDAQARGSHLKAYGKLLKDYYWAPHAPDSGTLGRAGGNAMRALGIGMTGLDLYQAMTGDPSQRRGDLAAAATGALIGPITGSMGWKLGPMAHVAVTNAARNLGHRLDPPVTPPRELVPMPPAVGPHIRRAIRAHNMLSGAPGLDAGSFVEGG
jgi:hypothetical protein